MQSRLEPNPFKFHQSGGLYDNFRVMGEHHGAAGKVVRVLVEEGVKAEAGAVTKLVAGVEEASRLFVAIAGQPIERAYPSEVNDPIVVKVHNRDIGAIWYTGLDAHRMVMSQLIETVTAGVLHEFVESYREDLDLVGDGVPFLAEFLFCGSDRRIFEEMAEKLQRNDPRDYDSHVKDWMEMVRLLLGDEYEDDDWVENQKRMDELKNSLDEAGKVNLVRSYLRV
jgi:hypothetical protein